MGGADRRSPAADGSLGSIAPRPRRSLCSAARHSTCTFVNLLICHGSQMMVRNARRSHDRYEDQQVTYKTPGQRTKSQSNALGRTSSEGVLAEEGLTDRWKNLCRSLFSTQRIADGGKDHANCMSINQTRSDGLLACCGGTCLNKLIGYRCKQAVL